MEDLNGLEILVCPESRQRLRPCSGTEVKRIFGGSWRRVSGRNADDSISTVLLREDRRCAYPVSDGIPILMVPEMLVPGDDDRVVGLQDPKYAEAYEEMDFYDRVASHNAAAVQDSVSFRIIEAPLRSSERERASFPQPSSVWLDATYDCVAQWEAYEHLGPKRSGRILQIGGQGIHAVKFLIAGFMDAWLVTPMMAEARCATALSQTAGVSERFHCILGVAEELPFCDNAFDGIYAGGCLHHTVTSFSLLEFARVLRPGGRFAAIEPWRAPLYGIGTKVFGKREPDVHCRPLTMERVEPLRSAFSKSHISQHGSLTRYPLLALSKMGFESRLGTVWHITRLDDAVSSLVPGLRRMGSSVALLGEK